MKTTKKRNLSKKQKPSSQDRLTEVKELKTLTIAELDAIAGGFGITINHNENLVSFFIQANRHNSL